MRHREIAEKINELKLNYPQEPTPEIIKLAKESNCVIAFGASDDLLEFRGAVEDEIGAYEGGTAYFDKNGLIDNKSGTAVKAIWCPEDGNGKATTSWLITTEIPHSTFDIYQTAQELHCIGIVFSLDDIQN